MTRRPAPTVVVGAGLGRVLTSPPPGRPSSGAEPATVEQRRPVDLTDLDGGTDVSKRIFLTLASLAALVLSSGANVSWMR